MHHIYHTHGFIINTRPLGEANKILTIYTKEMGLVRAIAQGIRLHKSKLRFALQDFSYAEIDLVRGRDIWRVTSATTVNTFAYARSDKQSLLLIARVAKLLERLCDGEESHEDIFNDFMQAMYILDDNAVSVETRTALELHLVLRVMNTLGYIGDSPLLAQYLGSDFSTVETEAFLKEKQSIIAHINKAINESQL